MTHHYLTAWRGQGTTLEPYTAIGGEGPHTVIDLRPDGTVPDGYALLALPEHRIIPGALYLGDEAVRSDERLPISVRRVLGNRLGLTVQHDRLPHLALELLTEHAGTLCKPLRPERNMWRIYLGGLLYEAPVISGGATLTETWTAADSVNLDADLDWTEVAGTGWGITSNAARYAGSVMANYARAEADLASVDHSVSATIVTFTYAGNANEIGVCCRFASAADTSYFFAGSRTPTPTNEHILRRRVTGTNTVLGSHAQDVATGVVIEVEANGSTIRGLVADVELVSVTDTNITTGTRGGIYGASTNASNNGVLDDWLAADLAAAGGTQPPRSMHQFRLRRAAGVA